MSAPEGSHPPFFANAQVMALDPADIFIPERIGFLHEDKAVALGRLMAVDGQRDPIKVAPRKGKQPWKLVTGRHRLRGAEIEGIQVWAIEVGGDASDHADLEASENLHRRPLGPIERAKFTAALVQAAQERIAREHGDLDQYQRAAKARWDRVKRFEETVDKALQAEADDAADKMSAAYGWQESVADALGLDKRTIRRDLSLYRLLIEPFPDVIEALSKHPIVGANFSQLMKIAAVEDDKRRSTIEQLLADDAIDVTEARKRAGVHASTEPATRTDRDVYWSRIAANFSRAGRSERARFLPKLVEILTPGERSDLRDLLDQGGEHAS